MRARRVRKGGSCSYLTYSILFQLRSRTLRLWHSLIHLDISIKPALLTIICFKLDRSRCLYLLYFSISFNSHFPSFKERLLHTLFKIFHYYLFVFIISVLYLIFFTIFFYCRNYLNNLISFLKLFSILQRFNFIKENISPGIYEILSKRYATILELDCFIFLETSK